MNQEALREITEQEVETFECDGAIMLSGILDMDWVERLRAALERNMSITAKTDPSRFTTDSSGGSFYSNMFLWQTDPVFADYVLRSPLPKIASQLMKSEKVNLLYDQIFVKEPGAKSSKTPWHNDQPYWAIRGWQVLSFWLALDPVTPESGAVEYVKGSHRWNQWFQPQVFRANAPKATKENPDFEPIPDIDSARDRYDIISWSLKAGDLLVHHGLTVHGAGGNQRSDVRRRGYAVRYTGQDVTYDPQPASSEQLLNPELAPGDPLDSEKFPVVWQKGYAANYRG